MRNALVIIAAAVAALVLLLGLRWLDLVSQDAVVVGFVTGIVIAVVITVANNRRQSRG